MQEEFAKLESENTGKPYKFVSLGADLMFSIDNLRFFAGAARDTHGSHAGEYWPGYTSIYRRDPVGRCGTDRSVELSADDGCLENRSRACGGMHDGLQACLAHATDQPHAG